MRQFGCVGDGGREALLAKDAAGMIWDDAALRVEGDFEVGEARER